MPQTDAGLTLTFGTAILNDFTASRGIEAEPAVAEVSAEASSSAEGDLEAREDEEDNTDLLQ